MPKLWKDSLDAHRRDVRQTIVEKTAALVAQHGIRGVTMSQIAEDAGIGRATLYKYFNDVEAILMAWHESHVRSHVVQLTAMAQATGSAVSRLDAVMNAYGMIVHQHHGTELAPLLHQGPHVVNARRELSSLLRQLLLEGAREREVRSDVAADELATYCIHALAAATYLPSKPAVRRLVGLIMASLRPSGSTR